MGNECKYCLRISVATLPGRIIIFRSLGIYRAPSSEMNHLVEGYSIETFDDVGKHQYTQQNMVELFVQMLAEELKKYARKSKSLLVLKIGAIKLVTAHLLKIYHIAI